MGNYKIIVTVYVADFLFSESVNLNQVLSSKFKIKDLGEVKQCLLMDVTFDKLQKSVIFTT